jgi:hypothetical protein
VQQDRKNAALRGRCVAHGRHGVADKFEDNGFLV